jgi:hypothetical protein
VVVDPLCLCPATLEYDPPCPRHGVCGIGGGLGIRLDKRWLLAGQRPLARHDAIQSWCS